MQDLGSYRADILDPSSDQINELEDFKVISDKKKKSRVIRAPKILLGFLSQHISD